MPYHHGLLNQPDPDRPWGRPQVPQSVISAAEEWGRNPQRPMVSPQGASIGPPQSRMSRIWDHLRHGIPRRVEEFLEPETPAGLAGLLGASVMEPAGTAIDVADFAAGFRDRDLARMGWAAGGAALPFVAGSTMRKVGQRIGERVGRGARVAVDDLSDDAVRRVLSANDKGGEWGELTGPELREAFAAFEADDPAAWSAFLDDPATRLDVPELRTSASPPSVAEGTPLVAEIGGDRSLLLTRNTYPDQGPWRITPISGDTGMSRGQHWHYETYDEAAQALAGSADDVRPAQAGSANIGAGVAGLLATGAVRGQRERE